MIQGCPITKKTDFSHPILSVDRLSVSLGERNILQDISLSLQYKEIFGCVGASGTGKTVLFRSILGLNEKKTGHIYFFGVNMDTATNVERLKIKMRTGILFQHGALFSSLNVLDNIQFPMKEFLDLSPTMMKELALFKLHMVGLSPDVAQKFPSQLSGGMIKRVALARALALDPDLLFLDEPTAGLDPIAAAEFDALIMKLRDSCGLTVYMITHDLDSLFMACDRIGVLGEKRILFQGELHDMLSSEEPWIKSYFRGKRARFIPTKQKA